MTNPIEEFRGALASAGLNYAGQIKADGVIHRFNAEGEKGDASWYVLYPGEITAGAYGCWRKQINEKWCSVNGNTLTPEQRAEYRKKVEAAEKSRRTEQEQRQFEAKKIAQNILSQSPVPETHLYLIKKSVDVFGEMRLTQDGCLALPLRDENGVLYSIQFIAPDKRFKGNRDKDFIAGGRVQGCYYTIEEKPSGPIIICEGYATGASIYDETGFSTVCAMYCGNLLPVAQALRKKYPGRTIVLAADNDRLTQGNPGVTKAEQAAKAINAVLCIPEFSDSDTESSDFNDLAEVSQKGTVRKTIELAIKEFLTPKFKDLPSVDNAAELVADDTVREPPMLIQDLLHQGLKGVLGSSSKARKSWILLDAAISVASGTLFWRWYTRPGKVLYINLEIPRAFIRRRASVVAEAKGVQNLSNLDIWTLRGYGMALYKLLPDLIKQITFGGYVLVIIDPIYKVLGGRDENAAGDIAELCNELERIAVASGAAVLYAAHFSKGNQSDKEAIDRIGGSGVTARDADSIITLTAHEEPDAYTVDLILRNIREQPSFVVKWDYPLMRVKEELNPESLKKAGGEAPPRYNEDDFLEPLRVGDLSTKSWQRKVLEEMGMSRRTFFNLRDRMVASNRVMKRATGDVWTLVTARPDVSTTPEQRALVDQINRANGDQPSDRAADPDTAASDEAADSELPL